MPFRFPLHFGTSTQIASQVAARLQAEAPAEPLAPWPVEVVVASGGLATGIATALLQRQREAGRPAVTARVELRTLDSLARALLAAHGKIVRVATDEERRLLMRLAARRIDDELTETRGIAGMLDRAWRDLRDSDLTLQAVEAKSRRVPLRHPGRTAVILRVWKAYEEFLAAIGSVDPAELLIRALPFAPKAAPQIIAGFYDLTGVQRAFVEALAAADRIAAFYMPAAAEEGEFAKPLVSAFTSPPEKGSREDAKWDVTEYERPDVEIRAVCESVAALLRQGANPSSVGIVTRSVDEHELELFHRHAAAAGFRLSAARETPLTAHRFGRITATLLRLRDRNFPRSEVLELVRDGLRTRTHVDVDRIDTETRRRRIAGGTAEELRRVGERSGTIAAYIALVEEIEPLAPAGARRPVWWSEYLRNVAASVTPESDLDLAAIERIEEIADRLRRIDPVSIAVDGATILDLLEQERIGVRNETAGTVWIGDVMRFRGRSFDAVFAARMQDDLFPQRRTEDPLVPDSDRAALGIRTIGDGRAEESFLFRLLFDGARQRLHFSFAGSDGFGRMLRPSSLLKQFVLEAMPERKNELLRNFGAAFRREAPSPTREPASEEWSQTALRPLQLIARAGTLSSFDGIISDPELLARFGAALSAVSPTHLEDFGECPQKFFFKHLLHVRELEEPEREVQIHHTEKGKADHSILEEFYRGLSADEFQAAARFLPGLAPELLERLEAAIDRKFAQLESLVPPANPNVRAIERRETLRHLRDFLALDLADLLSRELRPTEFEYSFGPKYAAREGGASHADPYVVPAGNHALRVEGQIDRIDTDRSRHRFRIVDYKSGKALRHEGLEKKIERGFRLQLALYAMAVAEFNRADAELVSGAIKPLRGTSIRKFSFELVEQIEAVRETLRLFATSIASGRFPAFPEEKDIQTCKYCPVNHSCRARHDLGEKLAATRMGDAQTLLRALEGQSS